MNWRTRLSGAPSDSVQCTRTVQVSTSHSRENEGTFHYNSPDCPVCQWSNDYLAPMVDSDSRNSVAQYRAKVRAAKSEGHRTVRCRKRTKLQRSTRLWTLTVEWRGGAPDTEQCLSGGALDCPVRPSPAASPTTMEVVRGYKYPLTTSFITIKALQTSH
jgi:hypothetical protein